MKKISVIMPVYNVQEYLKRAIDSVLNQSYKNIELILVDDGSTDDSAKICDEYENYENIQIVHKINGGVSSARNTGIDIATGDYIGFVDGDDVIDKTMYEKLINSLEQNNADMSMCGFKHFFNDGRERIVVENNLPNVSGENIHNFFITSGWKVTADKKITDNIMGSVCRILFKKDFIGDLRFTNTKIYEDLIFLIDLIKKDTKISAVNEPLYLYFTRTTSAMNSFSEDKLNNRVNGFKTIIEKTKNKTDKILHDAYKFYAYCDILNFLLKHNRKDLLKGLLKDEFYSSLNTKENYKAKKKLETRFTRKFAYFLVHKKMFRLYSILSKMI